MSGCLRQDCHDRIESLENRLALAMKQLEDLGCDNQWYIDQAQALIDKMHAHIPPKVCENLHLAAALGNRPCTICGENSWVKEKKE